jgi:hypothetical protein
VKQPEPGLWLSSTTGKQYKKMVTGLRTGVVDFSTDSEGIEKSGDVLRVKKENTALRESNAVCSQHITIGGSKSNYHKPVLDIDVPAMLVPSSTPGHSHLYIDRLVTWDSYAALLKAIAAAGVIQFGYMHASLRCEGTWVRTPWTRKGSGEDYYR